MALTKCSYCDKVCNIGEIGNAILVDFPFGHPLDTVEDFSYFCSSVCLIAYITEREINKKKGGE